MSAGFRLNEGDIAIENGEIEQIEGDELTAQTIQQVLSTNKDEWLFDTDEGIEFDNILGKRLASTEVSPTDENVIQAEIEQGIAQVDETLTVSEFACKYDKANRCMKVDFAARTTENETVEVSVAWR